MPLKNLSTNLPPASINTALFSTTYDMTFTDRTIAGNTGDQCKPRHCGLCGECRRKVYVENGSESVPNDGAGNPGLNPYKANGSYIIVEDPDPSASSYVEYYGESFKSLAAFNAVCDQDTGSRVIAGVTGCYDPLVSFDTNVADIIYIPTSHKTQTECLAFAATLPSGESAAWYTTENPSKSILYRGIGLDGKSGYINRNGPTE
tara:strand:+ start:2029 stop:2640 length:612 start_codon:yes stop_codon:yes gene_type:complete